MKIKKLHLKLFLLVMTISIISGCGSEEAPVELIKHREINPVFRVPTERLEVIATSDAVEINDVTIVNGHLF
ncbi:MAG: hypothetical protein IBX57_11670 [Gammaproteobacteria bacterium]|nr:hypothetical protein [Gammaproteobacteria bacterium]